MTVPVDSPLEKYSIFLNVFLNNYDIIKPSVDILSQVRKDYFITKSKLKKKVCLISDGDKLTFSYVIDNKGKCKWQAFSNGNLIQYSISESGGYRIEYKSDYLGVVFKVSHFDNMHIWQKTEYFDNSSNMVCYIMPWLNDDKAGVARYDNGDDIPEILFSLPMPRDEAMVQKLVNSVNPAISAQTNFGFSFFGNSEQEKAWNDEIKLLQEQYSNPRPQSDVNEDIIEEIADDTVYFDLTFKGEYEPISNTKNVFGSTESENTINEPLNHIEEKQNDSPILPQNDDEKIKLNSSDKDTTAHEDPVQEQDISLFNSETKPIITKGDISAEHLDADKVVNISVREKGIYFGEVDANGNRTGHGRTQTANGTIMYDGSYLNDNKDGFGVSFYKTGTIAYVGNWSSDMQNGFGIEFRPTDGSVTIGEFKDGSKSAVSTKYDKKGNLKALYNNFSHDDNGAVITFNENSGNMFVAKSKNGKQSKSGIVIDCRGNLIYNGECKNGLFDGFGTLFNQDNETVKYIGEFKKGEFCGVGILYDSDGTILLGSFANNLPNGRINKAFAGAVIGECIFNDGKCEYMREYSHDGTYLLFEGNIKDGKKEGMGSIFSNYGEKTFEGIFKDNEPFKNMQVITRQLESLPLFTENRQNKDYAQYSTEKNYAVDFAFNNGVYCGTTKDNLPHGKGTVLYADHRFTGEFKNGKPQGNGMIYCSDGTIIKGSFYTEKVKDSEKAEFSDVIYYYTLDSKED